MRLIDILDARHKSALKTAAFRDYEAVMVCLEKEASKTAAPAFISKAWNLLKKPFSKTEAEKLMDLTHVKGLRVLQQLLYEIPPGQSELKAKVQEALLSLGRSAAPGPGQFVAAPKAPSVLEITDQAMKLKASLQKNEAKMPLKAMLGLMGAWGLGTTGLSMLERKMVDNVHRENLDLISGDAQIPSNLKTKAKEMYGVLVTYAPSLAKDKTFSRDFTKNLIRHDTVDHKIVSDLISAEKAYKESKGRKAEFLAAMGDLTLKSTGWF